MQVRKALLQTQRDQAQFNKEHDLSQELLSTKTGTKHCQPR